MCHTHRIHQKDAENWLQPQFSVPYSRHSPERRWKLATTTVQHAILTAFTRKTLRIGYNHSSACHTHRIDHSSAVSHSHKGQKHGHRQTGVSSHSSQAISSKATLLRLTLVSATRQSGTSLPEDAGFLQTSAGSSCQAVVTWSCHWTPWTRTASALSRPRRPRRPVGRGLRFPSVSVCTPYVELLLE